jgi:lactoylglutathione lyase
MPTPLKPNGQDPDQSNTAKGETAITYWGVEDNHKEFDRLLKLGATEHSKPTNVGGEMMVATVKDPWGNVIGLINNPGFSPSTDNANDDSESASC